MCYVTEFLAEISVSVKDRILRARPHLIMFSSFPSWEHSLGKFELARQKSLKAIRIGVEFFRYRSNFVGDSSLVTN